MEYLFPLILYLLFCFIVYKTEVVKTLHVLFFFFKETPILF